MPAQSTATAVTQAERLAQLIKEHKEEVARLRAEIGDPAEALDKFVRDTFDLESFFPDPPSQEEPWERWAEDDDDLIAR